ncbi:MAG: pyruvate dehydrogenase E2 component (dihydrolipoamide acetyltransferase) [Desulforhopalus sp.]|jgi:pyruvate dehydrogenase E2 component (dihydrolipoamide acetyltransferase)
MTKMFRLPDLGEGVREAEILEIPVTIGQAVQEGDLILEVETDKAAVEIPSPITGIISQIHVQPGDMAGVGDVLISFTLDQDNKPPVAPLVEETQAQPLADRTMSPQNKGIASRRPVPASPSTRRLARELGVDLYLVTPSSASGVVSADDVKSYAATTKHHNENIDHDATLDPEIVLTTIPDKVYPDKPLPDFSQFGSIERHPFRSIRRATANRMSQSWTKIPHVNCQDMVDITMLEEFRQRHKDEIATVGGRLTMTVFTLKAVATALKTYPHFNASLDLVHQEIIIKKYFNIGVAVDTEHGLMVPVIRDVDRKSIKELSVELHQLVGKARERKLSRDELIGGSFTITNAGAIGGSHFSAIINHPEIAILGLGQGRMQPAVITDQNNNHKIVPRLLMPIVLCFDHRVVDGANAIRFLQVIINSLQDPDDLFINMI